jgi:hypothetical protein
VLAAVMTIKKIRLAWIMTTPRGTLVAGGSTSRARTHFFSQRPAATAPSWAREPSSGQARVCLREPEMVRNRIAPIANQVLDRNRESRFASSLARNG